MAFIFRIPSGGRQIFKGFSIEYHRMSYNSPFYSQGARLGFSCGLPLMSKDTIGKGGNF
jgi:hypothetical protein